MRVESILRLTNNSNGHNPQISPEHSRFRLRVDPSPIHRWGVYAGEDIPRGRKIIEYTGEKISRRETKRRADSATFNYLFTLNDYWTLDGSVGGSGAEYINHCCDPNVEARVVKEHIIYFALRTIKKGEELTVDYHFPHDVEQYNCGCGARSCRGTINLKKDPPKRKAAAATA